MLHHAVASRPVARMIRSRYEERLKLGPGVRQTCQIAAQSIGAKPPSRKQNRCNRTAPAASVNSSRAVRAKRVVGASTPAPSSVAALAARLPASSWSQRTVSEGPKGPIA